ncbi:factor-independent urate hydroxylase [Nesterenkonia sp. NBAIMH1]|uniref:factor-independent urate hydroxylase n=1 Tax=Nesterenkonia sp. NBAIMH1 TaxID=2600320 RepID=UPI0011B5DAE2|nr:urate oxidase [Nesterenkonia sp. NBAIMH1]
MSDFVSRSDIVLGPNQYGKAEVRVVRVSREADTHTLQDLNVTSFLRGDYQRCYTEGDNTSVIATDTQKNTVYAFAKKHGITTPEQFLHTLGEHFLDAPQVEGGRWTADSYPWERISVRGEPHPHSFVRSKQEVRTAAVTIQDGDAHILAGFKDLTVLKSTGSEFHGFPRDEYTTLPEVTDRIMATDITARWLYASDISLSSFDFDDAYERAKQQVLEQFALVHSLSLQQTLYAAGKAVLEAVPEIEDIRFEMPNNHHYAVNLEPFGLENPNEVFEAGVLPYGLMNASVTRASAPHRPAAWEWIGGFC